MISPSEYAERLADFRKVAEHHSQDDIYPHSIECAFESMSDCSLFYSIENIKEWFKEKRKSSTLIVSEIGLSETRDWSVNSKTGNITHISNDFFSIHGVRVESKVRERELGWDQPIIAQIGFDGGILGLIRKRFDGVPHYLCEAKEEPGNYGKVQLSPSLQATFANLNQKHGGRKPYFSELFVHGEVGSKCKVLFESWLAEDGGRLYLKRNKGILLEVDCDFEISLPNDNFIWLSLYQIKMLLREDAWINPHIRGILAHV